jgi:hypothetical protein
MSEIDTPPGIAAVLRELDSIHSTIRENRDAVAADLADHRADVKSEMDYRFNEISEKQDEQLEEAKKTNGRVRRLEVGYAVVKATISAFILLTPFILFYLERR